MSGGASSEPCLDGFFKPIWGTLATGAKVTVVLTDMIWSSNAGLGKVLPGGQIVRVSGLIPPSAHCANRVTLVDCKFLSVGMIVDLEVDDSSTVLCHQSLSMSHVFNLIEISAGVGLSALGCEKAGFRQVCAVEKQPKLAALHQRVHPDVPVICADITDDSAVCQVFAQCPEPATVMAGFSCQPFSRGGSQQGEHDSRSTSLPGTQVHAHGPSSCTHIGMCCASKDQPVCPSTCPCTDVTTWISCGGLHLEARRCMECMPIQMVGHSYTPVYWGSQNSTVSTGLHVGSERSHAVCSPLAC